MTDDEESESDIHCSRREQSGKGDAAAWLAKMEGTKTMAKKIAGDHEKTKFWDEYKSYQLIGEHGVRDWSSMAEAWNVFVAQREKENQNDVVKYYRKHAHMLESFFESGGKSNNIKATLQPHLRSMETLSKLQRAPVSAPSAASNAPGPPATHGPNSTSSENMDFSHMVSLIPMQMSNAIILTNQKSGPLVYPGQLQQTSAQKVKKKILERAIQVCLICGHYRQHNSLYNEKHIGKCNVPEEVHSIDRSLKGWCPCPECNTGADSVGYTKPVIADKRKRAFKICKTCGHYKHVGYYSVQHSVTDCRVLEENRRQNIHKGYCPCDICVATDTMQGSRKLAKLRDA